MSNILVARITIMLLVIMSALNAQAKNAIFDDAVTGFMLDVPNNWSVEYPPGRGRNNTPALFASSPDTGSSDPYVENLTVMVGKQPRTADIGVLMRESELGDKGMKSAVGNYKVYTLNKDPIRGMPAVWKTTSFIHPQFNKTVKGLSVMIGHKEYVYILIFSSIPSEYEKNEITFRKIAASFQKK